MPTLFTKIIKGEIPGRFVWKDDLCVSFLTIAPIRAGHVLVVPRQEVDHWLELEPELACHLMRSAQAIGKALMRAFKPKKVGMTVIGLEVPHVHIHLIPIEEMADMDFKRQNANATAQELDEAAKAIRKALREMGCKDACD